MELQEAIALIKTDGLNTKDKQTWADLGCGQGLFTYALAGLLAKGSTIYAVDENSSALKKINSTGNVIIKTLHSDFINDDLNLVNLDGILMANSLHYVKDKPAFIKKIRSYLKPESTFLVVEYDTDKPVATWVPYPAGFQSLKKIFSEAGYSTIKKLHEHSSIFNSGNIYSAIITR